MQNSCQKPGSYAPVITLNEFFVPEVHVFACETVDKLIQMADMQRRKTAYTSRSQMAKSQLHLVLRTVCMLAIGKY